MGLKYVFYLNFEQFIIKKHISKTYPFYDNILLFYTTYVFLKSFLNKWKWIVITSYFFSEIGIICYTLYVSEYILTFDSSK